jgi:hypothetical protein
MKSYISVNNLIILSLIIGLSLFLHISYSSKYKEGFSPRWLRTKKNRFIRYMRRSYKPYYNDYFKKLERFRRKWL